MRRAVVSAAALAVCAAALCGAAPEPSARPDPGAERAANDYLCALIEGDGATVRRLVPARLENKYGPCPFAETPRLERARVDAHRAGIPFGVKTKDPELADRGAITLTMLDDVKTDRWRVRQVAFFDKLPLGLQMPKRSVTKKDEAQEVEVAKAAHRYLTAWLKGDYQAMHRLAFDWQARVRKPVPGASVRKIELAAQPSDNGETKIRFAAKLKVYKLMPRTLHGTLFAMREGEEWKVRGTELMF